MSSSWTITNLYQKYWYWYFNLSQVPQHIYSYVNAVTVLINKQPKKKQVRATKINHTLQSNRPNKQDSVIFRCVPDEYGLSVLSSHLPVLWKSSLNITSNLIYVLILVATCTNQTRLCDVRKTKLNQTKPKTLYSTRPELVSLRPNTSRKIYVCERTPYFEKCVVVDYTLSGRFGCIVHIYYIYFMLWC